MDALVAAPAYIVLLENDAYGAGRMKRRCWGGRPGVRGAYPGRRGRHGDRLGVIVNIAR